MELNINSRQTRDMVRGAPGYRPTLNSYLWADALAIGRIADLAGDPNSRDAYALKAAKVKENLQRKLWDAKRSFFFPMAKRDEAAEGKTLKALSLTYQTGAYAGSAHGRELLGYVPWQFNLPDPGYESARKYLMDRDYFFAPFGPTTVERHDPLFKISKTCCWWSGNSWPYATTQTLKALANLLQSYDQQVVTSSDYLRLLQIYARVHRKNGKPYTAEAANLDTGSWEGHDSFNHSEHYFHSGYVDLIITGLVGLRPRADGVLEESPLAPREWDYFALDDVPYRGHRVAIVWDRQGTRYGLGKGLHLLVDGTKVKTSKTLGRVTASLKTLPRLAPSLPVNFAVNNDKRDFPRISTSFKNPKQQPKILIDGNYWYSAAPPNRWTFEGSPSQTDWCVLDFGVPRAIHTVKLYLLDDGQNVVAPSHVDLQYWNGHAWAAIPAQERQPVRPTGRRANVIRFPRIETAKLRTMFTHGKDGRTGLTEFEAWGDTAGTIEGASP
jgi:hypothetical protein